MPVTVTRTRRDVVTLTGPETLTYLQGQLSQDVEAMEVGDTALSFVLQPTGKVDTWVRVDRAGTEVVRLDTDPGAGAGLRARLERFKLRTKTEVELAEGVEVLAVRGAEVLDGVPCGWPGTVGSDVFDPDPDALPSDLPVDATELDEAGYTALRIAAGVPAMGAEVDEGTIPAELGQWVVDASVSFAKGCFTGQELVARIDSRGGNVPRHLRGLVLDGPPPAPGAAVEVDGQEVGRVTSAAAGPDGGSLALAFVKRAVEPPAAAVVDGAAVDVRALPLGDAG
ncbi:glycine cleavage T C-terminal barrel domain-containing protein [Iamia majanohamensis]|uniref:Glycine cleavage T C-terminal barrel domain-containing protein n=1 Tax=Iamia majanohamensis TaxID=467976 RepID=A0AAF0BXK0_9ACTN|nr:glycine cleavage T C-terminal barrel domain-containing protein [Iamia majanohamensis]WCO69038.1 glycine cleavage T C-terminal barrel domain-containing protein [Iamia majanohamensis]